VGDEGRLGVDGWRSPSQARHRDPKTRLRDPEDVTAKVRSSPASVANSARSL
jgi:hypothetical protein